MPLIDESVVRERLGVGGKQPKTDAAYTVSARESETSVYIAVMDKELFLSTSAARRLASMLLRCARRVEERNK